jgi:uncharacterized membrane-anchored protein
MSTRIKVAGLVVLSLVQLGAASWSIVRYERILVSGTPYKIRTEPIDPGDPFRGRYVAVRPAIVVAKPIAPETERLLQSIQTGDAVKTYVTLATDSEGFARVAGVLREPPAAGDYLAIDGATPNFAPRPDKPGESEVTGYTISFSFNRYYMNEAAAPMAEDKYVEASRRNAEARAWLNVRVKDGTAVIEGLVIDGVPIEELIRR